jgi:hypothetical protein
MKNCYEDSVSLFWKFYDVVCPPWYDVYSLLFLSLTYLCRTSVIDYVYILVLFLMHVPFMFWENKLKLKIFLRDRNQNHTIIFFFIWPEVNLAKDISPSCSSNLQIKMQANGMYSKNCSVNISLYFIIKILSFDHILMADKYIQSLIMSIRSIQNQVIIPFANFISIFEQDIRGIFGQNLNLYIRQMMFYKMF